MNKNFYQAEIGHLMKPNANFVAALFLFLIYITALCYLVIFPQQYELESSLFNVFAMGGLLGLAAYGTYDLTCVAIFKGFIIKVAVVDTLWGGILTASVATATTWIAHRFNWLS